MPYHFQAQFEEYSVVDCRNRTGYRCCSRDWWADTAGNEFRVGWGV